VLALFLSSSLKVEDVEPLRLMCSFLVSLSFLDNNLIHTLSSNDFMSAIQDSYFVDFPLILPVFSAEEHQSSLSAIMTGV